MVQVLEGLTPGETVVTSGQFLIDAESRMKEAIQKHLSRKNSSTQPMRSSTTAHDVETDALVKAYLDVSNFLGKPQQQDQPADVQPLIKAAEKLASASPPEKRPLAAAATGAATAMKDEPVERQRALLKPLSDAVIALVDSSPPTKSIADKLFVLHCPMADDSRGADWLQVSETVANPYFAKSMKTCGSVTRTIDLKGTR
jgi:Cu(I)/Ag(I) efflux system membrane fusion protein